MTKKLLAVAVLGSACGFAGLAFAQGKQGDAFGTDVSSQCAQMADPGAKADCVRLLRKDAGLGSERSWQGGSSASHSSQGVGSSGIGSGAGAGAGVGAGMGAGKSRR
jgi:hypothetical protein